MSRQGVGARNHERMSEQVNERICIHCVSAVSRHGHAPCHTNVAHCADALLLYPNLRSVPVARVSLPRISGRASPAIVLAFDVTFQVVKRRPLSGPPIVPAPDPQTCVSTGFMGGGGHGLVRRRQRARLVSCERSRVLCAG